jgi:hypothetical protein
MLTFVIKNILVVHQEGLGFRVGGLVLLCLQMYSHFCGISAFGRSSFSKIRFVNALVGEEKIAI